MIRPTRHARRGFSVVEVLIATVIFGIASVALAGLAMRSARRSTLNSVQSYQSVHLGSELARVTALPAAALVPGTRCDTTTSAPWAFQRCTTVANVSRRQQQVRVIVQPLAPGLTRPDTVIVDRASNVGALDFGGT
jgi:prepilin-type N-terminal cleavage/methylation domain-containing protein